MKVKSIARVSAAACANGISSHAKRGAPISTVTADWFVGNNAFRESYHDSLDTFFTAQLAGIIRADIRYSVGEFLWDAEWDAQQPFAVERTQKFLFVLKELMEQKQIPHVPVFCDSPMAIQAVQIFLKHTEEFTDETKALIARWNGEMNRVLQLPEVKALMARDGLEPGGGGPEWFFQLLKSDLVKWKKVVDYAHLKAAP